MPEGVIVGGWNFVVAAYSLVGTGLLLYAIHLLARLRSTRRQVDRERRAPASDGSTTPAATHRKA